MKRAWIVDGSWIARNVKNASTSLSLKIQNCDAYINCPKCSYHINNINVKSTPWPGLPKGVKFEPTDEEVIEHLEAKCGINNLKPHCLIQDFICSVTDDVGINYTHPQNLPGVKKDGISVFFFNKIAKAYQNGQRKRRKIIPSGVKDESVRWHKTGQTKPVMVNGVQKGCKMIMVLYKNAGKGLRAEKTNWVLHQYHLGREEGEVGDFVVSKITYQQQKQWEKTVEESECFAVGDGPRTPKPNGYTHPKPEISVDEDEIGYDDTNMVLDSFVKGIPEAESSFVENVLEDNLLSKEAEARSSFVEKNPSVDLENVDLETLSSLLSFGSEDSWSNWLDGFD